MHTHFFLDTGCFAGLVYRPLHPSLRVAAVEVPAGSSLGLAVEKPVLGRLSCYIGLESAHQGLAQRYIAVFFAFTLADVEHLSVEVQVREADVTGFKAAQP
jgi:hypothetical protein